jgi:hypothetical protein
MKRPASEAIMLVASDTLLIRSADILHAPIGTEEAVLMSVETGKYYGLNEVGSRVWALLECPKSMVQIYAQIFEEFEVEAETCEQDMLKYIEALLANGIVHAVAR